MITIDFYNIHTLITIILLIIIVVGFKYGDSSTNHGYLFFIGLFAIMLLIMYWIDYFMFMFLF